MQYTALNYQKATGTASIFGLFSEYFISVKKERLEIIWKNGFLASNLDFGKQPDFVVPFLLSMTERSKKSPSFLRVQRISKISLNDKYYGGINSTRKNQFLSFYHSWFLQASGKYF